MKDSSFSGFPDSLSQYTSSVGWREGLVAMAGFLALTVSYLHLTLDRFLTSIAPDAGDPLLNLAFLRWGADQASLGFPDFWNPTFFFPTRGVLALSDHLLGPAIGLAVLQTLGLSPAAGYNTLLLVGFAGGAFTSYLVLRWSGLRPPGAALGALAWSFSAFRWAELSHLQVLLALWVPLVLWNFDRLLADPTPRRALQFVLFYALHISGGAYLAYLIHLPLAAIFVVRNRGQWRGLLARRALPRTALKGAAFAACAALYLALYMPYLRLREQLGITASFSLVRPFLTSLFSWFQVGARTVYAEALPGALRSDTAGLFIGIVPGLLALFGVAKWLLQRRECGRIVTAADRGLAVYSLAAGITALALADCVTATLAIDNHREFRTARAVYYASAAVVLLAFALWRLVARRWQLSGQSHRSQTELWWAGLLSGGLVAGFVAHASGMMVLRALLPGFSSIRVPGRLFVFAGLALAALAGAGLDRLLSRLHRTFGRRVVTGLLFAFAILELAPNGALMQWSALPAEKDLPAVYHWLAEHDEVAAVVELPMLEYWRETPRLYFWTFHLRPLVNGHSGYLPPGYLERKNRFFGVLDSRDVVELASLGVTHVLVHRDQIPGRKMRRQYARWLKAVAEGSAPPLRVVREAKDVVVLQIDRDSASGLATAR